MAIKAEIKVIKATSASFAGAHYLAHIPNVGFAFIKPDEANFERLVLKFNMGQAYDVGALFRMTVQQQKNFPQHSLSTVCIEEVLK